MKSPILRTLLLLSATLLLAGAWRLACGDAWDGWPCRLAGGALLAAGLPALRAPAFRRVRREDRVVRLDAQACCGQDARSRPDDALAEADLLLARLTISRPENANSRQLDPEDRLQHQLAQIQTELAQLQQQAPLETACAVHLERARSRLGQVARSVRNAARAAEPI